MNNMFKKINGFQLKATTITIGFLWILTYILSGLYASRKFSELNSESWNWIVSGWILLFGACLLLLLGFGTVIEFLNTRSKHET